MSFSDDDQSSYDDDQSSYDDDQSSYDDDPDFTDDILKLYEENDLPLPLPEANNSISEDRFIYYARSMTKGEQIRALTNLLPLLSGASQQVEQNEGDTPLDQADSEETRQPSTSGQQEEASCNEVNEEEPPCKRSRKVNCEIQDPSKPSTSALHSKQSSVQENNATLTAQPLAVERYAGSKDIVKVEQEVSQLAHGVNILTSRMHLMHNDLKKGHEMLLKGGLMLSSQIANTGERLEGQISQSEDQVKSKIDESGEEMRTQIEKSEKNLCKRMAMSESESAAHQQKFEDQMLINEEDASRLNITCFHPLLSRHQHELICNLDITQVKLRELFSRGIISNEEKLRINNQQLKEGKAKLLLYLVDLNLCCNGEFSIDEVIDALKETHCVSEEFSQLLQQSLTDM